MKPKFAKSYVLKILYSENPYEAVEGILSFVHCNTDIAKNKKRFGMVKPNFYMTVIMSYLGDVGNGGHYQYFSNPSGNNAQDTINALVEVKIMNLADILTKASQIFSTAIPIDQDERISVLEALDPKQLEYLNIYDQELYKFYNDETLEKMQKYLIQEWDVAQRDIHF